MKKYRKISNDSGFTIIELMIATAVFSLILVVITFSVIKFTNSYYKSSYQSATQSSTRNIVEAVTSAVQFGKSTISAGNSADAAAAGSNQFFCAGGYVFVYKKFDMYQKGDVGMYSQPMGSTDCATSATLSSADRVQYMGERMRITYLSFLPNGGGAQISVKLAYGDDLSPSLFTDGGEGVGRGKNVQCRPEMGNEYCAVSSMSATATSRVFK